MTSQYSTGVSKFSLWAASGAAPGLQLTQVTHTGSALHTEPRTLQGAAVTHSQGCCSYTLALVKCPQG